ncbi:MAG: Zinc metalloprotease, partial [Desulfonauticus sp. 38_4375]
SGGQDMEKKKLELLQKKKKSIHNFLDTMKTKEYVSNEVHYFKGKKYILNLKDSKRSRIEIDDKKYIYFYVPSNYTLEQKQKYYENWLRKELKKELERLVPKWEKIIEVKAREVRIKKMKTRWGSCNFYARRIWINLELIKRPLEHLEYVIVHELVHFLEKSHNKRFKSLLDLFLPQWRLYKQELNQFILDY